MLDYTFDSSFSFLLYVLFSNMSKFSSRLSRGADRKESLLFLPYGVETTEIAFEPTATFFSGFPFPRCDDIATYRTSGSFSRKEVFQPHLPVRLPCYDLAPITRFTLGRSSRSRTSGTPDFHGLTGGVYKARERIHRAMADARLLANPTSRSRVADSDPN